MMKNQATDHSAEMDLPALTAMLREGAHLGKPEVVAAVAALLDENSDDDGKAAFLKALSRKGETSLEITHFSDALLQYAVRVEMDYGQLDRPAIDVVGTGGDKLHLFNISTTAALLLAAGGCCVVKHGNRSISSKSGGADVLEALGVRIDLPPDDLTESVKRTGFGFIFAQQYHPAFKAVGPVRKKLAGEGVTTIFNKLGPLLNPAQPPYQLAGVFSRDLQPFYAEVLQHLKRSRAWVVHCEISQSQGADELTNAGANHVYQMDEAGITETTLNVADLQMAGAELPQLQGGGAAENAVIIRDIFQGDAPRAHRDVAALNAAAGFVVTGLEPDLAAGLDRAYELIDSGAALRKLEEIQNFRG